MHEDEQGRTTIFLKNGRLRPTLRVIVYLVFINVAVLFVVGVPLGILARTSLITPGVSGTPLITGTTGVVEQLLTLVAIVAATFIARRTLDHRSFLSLGFIRYSGWLVDVAVGIVLGLALIGIVFAFETASGLLTVVGFGVFGGDLSPGVSLASAFVVFAIVGIDEELMSRGYILQNLAAGWGILAAVAASSVLFALLHAGNPNVTILAIANLFVAGVFFAVAYHVAKSLWLPIALHFAWNFAEGPIFGFPVSGLRTVTVLSTARGGPDVVTGGAFGPEGGVVGLGVLIIGIAMLYLWGRARRRLGVGTPSEELT